MSEYVGVMKHICEILDCMGLEGGLDSNRMGTQMSDRKRKNVLASGVYRLSNGSIFDTRKGELAGFNDGNGNVYIGNVKDPVEKLTTYFHELGHNHTGNEEEASRIGRDRYLSEYEDELDELTYLDVYNKLSELTDDEPVEDRQLSMYETIYGSLGNALQ